MIEEIRETAAIVSDKAAGKMVKTSIANNPPAEYEVGDDVIIKRFGATSRRKSGRDKWLRFVKGTVEKHNQNSSSYKVSYLLDGKQQHEWFKVSDITSLTLDEELVRHDKTEGAYIIYSCTI